MALTDDDRKFITAKIFRIAILTGLVTAAIAGYVAFRAAVAARGGGDSPVVLVGGSLIFRAGDTSYTWQQDSATEYHVSPTYPVTAIAVKAKSSGDTDSPTSDGDAQSDRLRVDISSGSTWEVDEFVSDSAQPVTTLTPQGNAIYLDLKDTGGFLCKVTNSDGTIKKIQYGRKQDCSDNLKFSSIGLTVTISSQPQMSGTINCLDQTNSVGTCRIIFRGP